MRQATFTYLSRTSHAPPRPYVCNELFRTAWRFDCRDRRGTRRRPPTNLKARTRPRPPKQNAKTTTAMPMMLEWAAASIGGVYHGICVDATRLMGGFVRVVSEAPINKD